MIGLGKTCVVCDSPASGQVEWGGAVCGKAECRKAAVDARRLLDPVRAEIERYDLARRAQLRGYLDRQDWGTRIIENIRSGQMPPRPNRMKNPSGSGYRSLVQALGEKRARAKIAAVWRGRMALYDSGEILEILTKHAAGGDPPTVCPAKEAEVSQQAPPALVLVGAKQEQCRDNVGTSAVDAVAEARQSVKDLRDQLEMVEQQLGHLGDVADMLMGRVGQVLDRLDRHLRSEISYFDTADGGVPPVVRLLMKGVDPKIVASVFGAPIETIRQLALAYHVRLADAGTAASASTM